MCLGEASPIPLPKAYSWIGWFSRYFTWYHNVIEKKVSTEWKICDLLHKSREDMLKMAQLEINPVIHYLF